MEISKHMKSKKEQISNYMKSKKEQDVLHYTGRNTDLDSLAETICKWFQDSKYITQKLSSESDKKWLVQARKKGVWRACTASARDIAVVIEGDPNDFTVLVHPSKWINNLTSLTVLTILSLGSIFPFCGIATAWILKIRRDLKEFIDLRVDFVEKAAESAT